MKKYYLLLVSIIIIFGTYTFLIQKHQKQASDEAFMYNLNEAAYCFAVDYTKFDEEDKISFYMKAAANLNTAIYILPSTSYENNKNSGKNLEIALSGLYRSIILHSTPQSTNRFEAFNQKRSDIYRCLHYIIVNPNDRDSCKALAKITESMDY